MPRAMTLASLVAASIVWCCCLQGSTPTLAAEVAGPAQVKAPQPQRTTEEAQPMGGGAPTDSQAQAEGAEADSNALHTSQTQSGVESRAAPPGTTQPRVGSTRIDKDIAATLNAVQGELNKAPQVQPLS